MLYNVYSAFNLWKSYDSHLFPQSEEAQSFALVIVYSFGQSLMIYYSLCEF